MSDDGLENVKAHIRQAEVEIECLSRRLDAWQGSRASHFFKRTVAEKQRWVRTHADWLRIRERLESAGQNEQPVVTNVKSKAEWYESSEDVRKRRAIVLNNPKKPAKSLCTVFDTERVPLPNGWESRYNATSWTEAYKDKKARAAIQRIISTDKRN